MIFGVDSADEKQVYLKKYKFKEAALTLDKGRNRKLKKTEDLHSYLICVCMNSELIICLPENYEFCYHSTRNQDLSRV